MSVCSECCFLSGRGLCDELITRPDESYILCCIVVCDLENLVNVEAMAHGGGLLSRQNKQTTDGKHIYERPQFISLILNVSNF